jgi:hypothetical protein
LLMLPWRRRPGGFGDFDHLQLLRP